MKETSFEGSVGVPAADADRWKNYFIPRLESIQKKLREKVAEDPEVNLGALGKLAEVEPDLTSTAESSAFDSFISVCREFQAFVRNWRDGRAPEKSVYDDFVRRVRAMGEDAAKARQQIQAEKIELQQAEKDYSAQSSRVPFYDWLANEFQNVLSGVVFCADVVSGKLEFEGDDLGAIERELSEIIDLA